MNIQDCLLIFLREDILASLIQRYPTKDPEDLEKRIDAKVNSVHPVFDIPYKRKKRTNLPSDERCCARTWDNHRGSRCNHKIKEGDYCGIHIREIKERGSLLFGRYDETRPTINEKKNVIPWYDGSPIQELNTILSYQKCAILRKMRRESKQ